MQICAGSSARPKEQKLQVDTGTLTMLVKIGDVQEFTTS
jgi:hypothetical protein